MNEQDQIKTIAELDGWQHSNYLGQRGNNLAFWFERNGELLSIDKLPDYLHSYDAIIPLIQKQDMRTKECIIDNLTDRFFTPDGEITRQKVLHNVLLAPPSQLCEALLRATGKWIE